MVAMLRYDDIDALRGCNKDFEGMIIRMMMLLTMMVMITV